MSNSALAWMTLVLALSSSTFGLFGSVAITFCASSLLLGILSVLIYHGRNEAKQYLANSSLSRLDFTPFHLECVKKEIMNPVKIPKYDKRMTGSIIIDEPLHEIIQLAIRDYVQTWYDTISDDEQFIQDIGKSAQEVIISFSNRSKEINWIPFITTQLVDDFASHLRLFKKTQHKLKKFRLEEPNHHPDINAIFFNFELEMENICRDSICNDEKNEKAFLRDVIDILLFLLIAPENFENKAYRFLLREIFISYLVMPTFEAISDPDYINQYIIWMCKDVPVNSEGFLTIIKSSDSVDELVAILESINHEIAVQRAKDTGGNDDTEIRQRLSSLFYVKKNVEAKIQRLNDGVEETDSLGLPSQIDWQKWLDSGSRLPQLELKFILKNNVALSYFMDYMTSVNCQAYLFFYLNVEGYKVSAEQQLSAVHLTSKNTNDSEIKCKLESLRQAALSIYQTCLSEEAVPRIIILDSHQNEITQQITKKLFMRITTDPEPSEFWFDEAQQKIYEMFQFISKFFPNFQRSVHYIKLLAELDLLKDVNKSDDEDVVDAPRSELLEEPLADINEDTISIYSENEDLLSINDSMSLNSSDSGGSYVSHETAVFVPNHVTLTADIVATAKETTKNKSYTVYEIRVIKIDDNEGIQDEWTIYRRYSDFHDFHMVLIGKFENVSKISFPGKKAFNNMNKEFLKKRTISLKEYLMALQDPYILSSNKGLKDFLYNFLLKGSYEKEKSIIARRVEDIVKPLKIVKETVMNVPDNLVDGVVGMKAGISRVLANAKLKSAGSFDEDCSKVGAALLYPENSIDNIPLRIMLLLMDEIFDLKSRNLWLRRRIVTFLRQIIKATYGDMINRKIVDYVQWMLSAEQVSEYIRSFRDSYWPNGLKCPPYPERDKNTKMRTRVAAKLVMMCAVSEELKKVIGSETYRKGVMCVFEMFQNKTFNKRLLYVLLEGVLETLFYSNNFDKTFHVLYTHFQKLKKESKSQ